VVVIIKSLWHVHGIGIFNNEIPHSNGSLTQFSRLCLLLYVLEVERRRVGNNDMMPYNGNNEEMTRRRHQMRTFGLPLDIS